MLVISLCWLCGAQAQKKVASLWKKPTSDYRMKTWWFFGFENTTNEGITADVEAFKKAGFGGVVYYDQNHRGKTMPEGLETPDEGFSSEWWQHLKWTRTARSWWLNLYTGMPYDKLSFG